MAFSMNGNRRAAMAEINVTPLVDVMLVLLIIFMVTAPMMQEGIDLTLPEANGRPISAKPNVEPLVVSVTGTGNIYIDDAPVQFEDLAKWVTDAVKKNPARQVHMRADKSVPYGTVVRIMAALSNAGIKDLGMITSPEEKAAPAQ